jgi:hypothetical protein
MGLPGATRVAGLLIAIEQAVHLGNGALVGVIYEPKEEGGEDVLLGDLALSPELEDHAFEPAGERRWHPPEDAGEGLGGEVGRS